MRKQIEAIFPRLVGTEWKFTSPESKKYNCIAWAADDHSKWWWPHPFYGYWPPGAPVEETLDAFIQAFSVLGYKVCNDSTLEPGVEKVAIFAKKDGTPTHGARQLPSGKWTSKLGNSFDIQHELEALEAGEYGAVAVIMSRPQS